MNAREFLESESVLYAYLPQDVRTLLESLVVYEWTCNFQKDTNSTAEVVHTIISIVMANEADREDLVAIAKLSPYLSPVAFLSKPCDVNTVLIKVAEILKQRTQERVAEYKGKLKQKNHNGGA